MSGSTPGPWAVAPNANAGRLLVYSEDMDRHCPAICEVTGRDDEREANARAISALPDLLTALYAVSLHLMVRPEARLREADENVRTLVMAAIARAEGGGA